MNETNLPLPCSICRVKTAPDEAYVTEIFKEVDCICEEIDRADKEEGRAGAKTEPLRVFGSKW